RDRLLARAERVPRRFQGRVAGDVIRAGQVGGEHLSQLVEPVLAPAIVRTGEVGRDDEVAIEPRAVQRLLDEGQLLVELEIRLEFARVLDFEPARDGPAELALDDPSGEVPLFLRLPVESLDLLARQTDQRIAAPQRMV